MTSPNDHEGAIEALAARKLAERERTRGPVGNPVQWLKAVREGIRIDHAGRIATMPAGLPVNDQVKWIENGPPAPGARIPSPHTPTDFGDGFLPAETWRKCMDEARANLPQHKEITR